MSELGLKLEKRTFTYSKAVLSICSKLRYSAINKVLVDQVIRSSCSTGANYIEANEAVSKRDFVHKLKITRKEVKESIYHLRLLSEFNNSASDSIRRVIDEGIELRKLFSAIINRVEKNDK